MTLYILLLIRFSICRNLLLLQQLLLECHQKLSYLMDSAGVDTIRSVLLPRVVVLTQAYYVVMWVSETPATATVASTVFNSSLQRMAILKLNEPAGQYLPILVYCILGCELRAEVFLILFRDMIHVPK